MSPTEKRRYLPACLHALMAAAEWVAGERTRQVVSHCFFPAAEETTRGKRRDERGGEDGENVPDTSVTSCFFFFFCRLAIFCSLKRYDTGQKTHSSSGRTS